MWPWVHKLRCDSLLELLDVGAFVFAIGITRWVRAAGASLRSCLLGCRWHSSGRALLLGLLLARALGLASDEVLDLRNNFGSHFVCCLDGR